MIFVHVNLGQEQYLLGKRVLIYQLFFQYVPVIISSPAYFYALYPNSNTVLLWSASSGLLPFRVSIESKGFLDLTKDRTVAVLQSEP
jgi:hypothetical protein